MGLGSPASFPYALPIIVRSRTRSCNNHVTISFTCGVLEVLQHHLRPLSYCKAVKGDVFHGGNTGSNPVGDAKLNQIVSSIADESTLAPVTYG